MPRSFSSSIQSMVDVPSIDLADPVIYACIVQDSLCSRCLSGINMRHDADVSDHFLHLYHL